MDNIQRPDYMEKMLRLVEDSIMINNSQNSYEIIISIDKDNLHIYMSENDNTAIDSILFFEELNKEEIEINKYDRIRSLLDNILKGIS